MGQAREVMDRATDAMNAHDKDALVGCYADDAVGVTPDEGQLSGRDRVTNYLFQLWEAFPDLAYESAAKYEAENVAIDEGIVTGTNTGALKTATGEALQPTGKQIRVRGCDIAHVEGGLIKTHHFYFDQLEFLGQLGLLPESMTRQMSSH
ncbi:nuclear transport factor 2 family protein [Pseudarthrobacter sulfonivorans]|jgi:ketosteroid isomerase-like protein|uniref:ester cyclase n=1 Tax=Pseudarthrobacter sulfonivorans TaxID=121292 RepID=UPI002866B1F3|nr:nuclear transport factor 2 family protein [Pseudarthrobacter sulfonivorans]MDR6415701.1 ketosteroid isomerase-like protein [Pseudarthrobacter sulfonivorans]